MTKRKVPISQHVTTAMNLRRQFSGQITLETSQMVDDLITFLEWCRNNEETLKTAALIQRDEALKKVKAAFPDAEMSAVRRSQEYIDD